MHLGGTLAGWYANGCDLENVAQISLENAGVSNIKQIALLDDFLELLTG